MGTMKGFIVRNRISLTSELVAENPNWEADNRWDGYHWKCHLRRGNKQMTAYFSKGSACTPAEPGSAEVLDCLAMDSAGTEDSFEEWAPSLGYDPDSRRAERIYNTCVAQAEKLQNFLGAELYEELLWNTERE